MVEYTGTPARNVPGRGNAGDRRPNNRHAAPAFRGRSRTTGGAMARYLILLAAAGAVAADGEAKKPEPVRFDYRVRQDLFKGFAGDPEALARGVKTCEDVLATEPKHAEALVWHGSALLQMAGAAFQKGDAKTGMKNWTQGLKELDLAIKYDPENVGVRVPRASVLTAASRFVPEAQKKPLLAKAKADWEFIYAAHKGDLSGIGSHPRGELLFALAEVHRRTGDEAKAQDYLAKVIDQNPGSKYADEAKEWQKDVKQTAHSCIGCHTPGK